MKEADMILNRILERARLIVKLRRENDKDREILMELEGRKGADDEV